MLKQIDPGVFQTVHTKLGVALWHVQMVEWALARYIVGVMHYSDARAKAEAVAMLEETGRLTLGALFAKLRIAKTGNAVSSVEAKFADYLKERNWLVHNSWESNHADLFNPDRLPPFLARIDAISEESLRIQRYFCGLFEYFTSDLGFSHEQREAELHNILREWGIGE